MEFFDTNGLVITFSGNVDSNTKEGTNSFENAFEGAAIVNDDDAAKAEFEQNFLHEKTGKVMGCNVRGGIDNDKTGEVTHDVEEVCFTAVVSDFARGPEVNVEDIEGAAEGPGEDKFAVPMDSAICGEAVRAF